MAFPKTKKWIAGMHLKKGALHRQLHVPIGKKIPEAMIDKAMHAKGLLGQRARLADTMGDFRKRR
jgi:hypothetical protein